MGATAGSRGSRMGWAVTLICEDGESLFVDFVLRPDKDNLRYTKTDMRNILEYFDLSGKTQNEELCRPTSGPQSLSCVLLRVFFN